MHPTYEHDFYRVWLDKEASETEVGEGRVRFLPPRWIAVDRGGFPYPRQAVEVTDRAFFHHSSSGRHRADDAMPRL